MRALAGRARGQAARRTLEADLKRYLRHEAENGAGLEPEWLEWRFGREGDEHGPLVLAPGELEVTGRVDRVDVGATARRSCATTRARARRKGAGWAEGGALQVALYMLAARELLGLQPVGGLYQPLWSKDSRPRGLVRDDVAGRYVNERRRRRARARGGARRDPRARAVDRRGAARRADRAVRGEVLARRLRVPDDLQGGRMTAP